MASLSGVLRQEGGSLTLAWGEGCGFQAEGDTQAAVLGPARKALPASALALAAWPAGAETILRPFLQAGLGFAFAVREGNRLTLGTDPWGLQPLYYREGEGGVRFGDRQADLTRPGEEKLLLASCEHFMRYFTVPTGRTLLGGVRRVPPGERVIIAPEGITSEPFPPLSGEVLPGRGETRRRLRRLLEEAVGAAADLPEGEPVGLLLSGGMDSTALLAILREVRGGPIVAIHAGAEGSPDREFARAVAGRYGAEFLDLALTAQDARESLGWIVSGMEAPGGNASAVANCRAFAQARERGLRRVLSGLGADEVFAGHRKHLLAPWWPWLSRLPLAWRRALARRASHPSLREALLTQGGPLEMHRAMYALMGEEACGQLRGGLARFAQAIHPGEEPSAPSRYPAAILQADLDQWLRGALAPMAGALASAEGVELALPLASLPLMRLSAPMPLSWKVRGRAAKRILHEALGDVLPAEVMRRPRRGFTVPVSDWLRGGLAETAEELLSPERVERWGLLHREGPLRLLKEHARGPADWGPALWGWMTFSAWYDRVFPRARGV
ncbi:MAG: asparagine synthase-related protein [Nitrospinota bacterium]